MINWIKKFLGMEYRIDNLVFRKALREYPYNNENATGSYLYNITNVDAFQKGNKVRVVIVTHSVGVLIGRKGKQIEELTSLMSQMTGKEVSIDLKESKIFSNLYGRNL